MSPLVLAVVGPHGGQAIQFRSDLHEIRGRNQIGQDDVALNFQMFDLLSRGKLRPVGSDPPGIGRRIGRFDWRSDGSWRGHGSIFDQKLVDMQARSAWISLQISLHCVMVAVPISDTDCV